MHSHISWKTLQVFGHIYQLVDVVIFGVKFLQIGANFHGLFDVHANFHWDGFGGDIAKGVWKVKGATNIADDVTGGHGLERGNLHHLFLAVFSNHVVDNFLAALVTKVHVNIGHGHTLRI